MGPHGYASVHATHRESFSQILLRGLRYLLKRFPFLHAILFAFLWRAVQQPQDISRASVKSFTTRSSLVLLPLPPKVRIYSSE